MSILHEKDIVKQLGFSPKEKEAGIFNKKYANGHVIEVDFVKETINYGKDIKCDSKTTQNFSQAENFVVLECVNRLLEKGYNPKDIVLEKVFPSGHGHSGRLDIFVKNGKKVFLMIECKTWGTEFDKEYAKIQKNGGQLFTYFQNDTNTDYLMLYASHCVKKMVEYKCEIIKIEDNYRTAGNVEDVYNRWNKITNKNGIFEEWVEPYTFQNKLLTKKDLIPLTEEDSGKLFNAFASILRKHTVSDKPNAFNKIFNLFLAKIYDEKKGEDDELDFQWKEGKDNAVDFEVRLINLHTEGLLEFLRKEIEGIHDKDFEGYKNLDDLYIKKKKRLKMDKILDIKEVFDDDSFEDNFRVLKEVVQLLEKYQIRYPRRQRHLSDFFERLLTTGLKQEAGQYFTPVPITHFIVRSLPVREMIEKAVNSTSETLPTAIDYAAGSGHFITDILETYQDIIDNLDTPKYPAAAKKVKAWQSDQYLWAAQYVYGIEKDYRLVKVAKVGCYFYGDGLAQVFHADGLDNFAHSLHYDGLLRKNAKAPQFDIVVSNPPYSVDAFRGDLRSKTPNDDFTLYKNLTDKSSEIECLFVERTVHLLKEGGVAGIILPSSMLSNTGIYTKTREIILENFDIIGITKLGSKTFMETGTNTVVLFLRKRNSENIIQIKETIESVFASQKDCTVNGIEKAFSLYLNHVWSDLSLSDYKSFLQMKPNDKVKNHPLYKEYQPTEDTWNRTLNLEKEKFLYFVLAYPQTVVLVKTGEKNAEKRFLGYEFSKRRRNEGIHPIQRSKTIEECTHLFDDKNTNNPEKASAYIYEAFLDDYKIPVHESLKDNISRVSLVDMLTFDRKNFEKNISLAISKKKVKIESKWELVKLIQLVDIVRGASPRPIKEYITNDPNGINWIKIGDVQTESKYIYETKEKITSKGAEKSRLVNSGDFILSNSMSFGRPYIMKTSGCIHDGWLLITNFEGQLNKDYLYYILSDKIVQQQFVDVASGGTAVDNLNIDKVSNVQIPLPPKEIQQKIVEEIEVLEKREIETKRKIDKNKGEIEHLINNVSGDCKKLRKLCKYSDKRIDCTLLTSQNYIGVDNMLQNMMGKTDSIFVPDSGTVTEYNMGDILLSNIRPYLKKIWYADNNGGCSNDVLVLQRTDESLDSKYVFYNLKQDKFFDYEMLVTKGVKMPRGDKQHILDYEIPAPSLPEQKKIVSEIEKIETQIQDMQEELAQLSNQKELVLKKYL